MLEKRDPVNLKSASIISLAFLIFFSASCAQKNDRGDGNSKGYALKNKSLPKEIKLNAKTSKIIDSVFSIKNDRRQLESVQVFNLKKGILISANRKYYKNETLNQTTNDRFDENGNNIESNTNLHFKNSSQIFKRKLDEAGNIIELISIEDGRPNVLEQENSYKENRLVSVVIRSKQSGSVIRNTINKYDVKGNLLEELNKYISGNANNFYQYNDASQVVLHKHFRDGKLHDSIVYHYANGLPDKEEWYENPPANPMVTTYQYNDRKQLVVETEETFGNTIYYKNYDADGNWQAREQYSDGKMRSLTKRLIISN